MNRCEQRKRRKRIVAVEGVDVGIVGASGVVVEGEQEVDIVVREIARTSVMSATDTVATVVDDALVDFLVRRSSLYF